MDEPTLHGTEWRCIKETFAFSLRPLCIALLPTL